MECPKSVPAMAMAGFPPPPYLHTIFVDTSIDTHLAMTVSLCDTIRNVKAKIKAEHVLCFQDVGEISIQAIKVKRRGFFYILADSMYVSNAFDGVKGGWFFCIDVLSVCPVKDQEVVSNKVMNAHDVAVSPFEAEKNSCPDGQGHHDTISTDIDNEHRPEMLIVQEKDKKQRKKTKNDSYEQLLDDQRGSKFSGSHNVDESNKSTEISCGGKKILVTSLEGLHSKLTNKDTDVLQKPWMFDKQTKKRRRNSSKSHEEARLPMPSETLLTQSPRVHTLPCCSGKESDISVLGNIDKVLPSDARDMKATADNPSFFEVANQQEKDTLSMETHVVVIPSVNKEPVEYQILQVNPEDQREKNVNSAEGTNSDELMSERRQNLELTKANGQEYMSSTQVDGNLERLNSDSAQVSLNEIQNVFIDAKSMKQADQKAGGGHCIGTVSEISSASMKVPHQDTVSQMNSNNPPNNIPSNLSEVSNMLVDHAPAAAVRSLPASVDQAKTLLSRKNSKSGLSKVKFPETNGAVLPKSNGEITESNEGSGSDPSNLANVSNQNKEQHHVDANTSVPLFVEVPLNLAKIPLMNPLHPCEEALDGPALIKGDMTTHTLLKGAMEGPTVSKSERNKSKMKALNVQNFSEISEHSEIQDYGSQALLQPSRDREVKQGHKTVDTVVSYDQCAQYKKPDPSTRSNIVDGAVGSTNFDFSHSQDATNHESSSESTEDTPHHLRRFRVVRKIPIRRQKQMLNISNPEVL